MVVWAVTECGLSSGQGRKSDWLLNYVCVFSLISLEAIIALKSLCSLLSFACRLRVNILTSGNPGRKQNSGPLGSTGGMNPSFCDTSEPLASTLAFALAHHGEVRLVCLTKDGSRTGEPCRQGFVSHSP